MRNIIVLVLTLCKNTKLKSLMNMAIIDNILRIERNYGENTREIS